MKSMRKYFQILGAVVIIMSISGCSGAYVGVGVHSPGPWAGPYGGPGVTIGTGRPISLGYYPCKPDAMLLAAGDVINDLEKGPGEQRNKTD